MLLICPYSEEIVKQSLAEETVCIKVNGKPINDLRFVHDTTPTAECLEYLQRLVEKIMASSEENGLTSSVEKQSLCKEI